MRTKEVFFSKINIIGLKGNNAEENFWNKSLLDMFLMKIYVRIISA